MPADACDLSDLLQQLMQPFESVRHLLYSRSAVSAKHPRGGGFRESGVLAEGEVEDPLLKKSRLEMQPPAPHEGWGRGKALQREEEAEPEASLSGSESVSSSLEASSSQSDSDADASSTRNDQSEEESSLSASSTSEFLSSKAAPSRPSAVGFAFPGAAQQQGVAERGSLQHGAKPAGAFQEEGVFNRRRSILDSCESSNTGESELSSESLTSTFLSESASETLLPQTTPPISQPQSFFFAPQQTATAGANFANRNNALVAEGPASGASPFPLQQSGGAKAQASLAEEEEDVLEMPSASQYGLSRPAFLEYRRTK